MRDPLVSWPDIISIDYATDRLYWTDGDYRHIASSDLDGNDYRVVIKHDRHVQRPYPLAIHGENLYWADYDLKTFSTARANQSQLVKRWKDIRDIKAVSMPVRPKSLYV